MGIKLAQQRKTRVPRETRDLDEPFEPFYASVRAMTALNGAALRDAAPNDAALGAAPGVAPGAGTGLMATRARPCC